MPAINRPVRRESGGAPRTGLARALSKLGFCSRSQAWDLIRAGRVQVNGRPQVNPEFPVVLGRDRIVLDDAPVASAAKVYLMLNKPRGLVTTRSDEKGRPTVFECLAGETLPFLSPVGRLDQASEGLLLFTNDTAWAANITDPAAELIKTYHVQVDCLVAEADLERMRQGVNVEGERLAVVRVAVLRAGERNCWLEIQLNEGRNRHIRRLLEALNVRVLRLVRVAVGPLVLGTLAKGKWRRLDPEEVKALGPASSRSPRPPRALL